MKRILVLGFDGLDPSQRATEVQGAARAVGAIYHLGFCKRVFDNAFKPGLARRQLESGES